MYVNTFCKCIMLPLPKGLGSSQSTSILFANALCYLYRKVSVLVNVRGYFFRKCIMLPLPKRFGSCQSTSILFENALCYLYRKVSVLVNLRRYFSQMHYVTFTEKFWFLSIYVDTFRKCIMLPLLKTVGSCQSTSILFVNAFNPHLTEHASRLSDRELVVTFTNRVAGNFLLIKFTLYLR